MSATIASLLYQLSAKFKFCCSSKFRHKREGEPICLPEKNCENLHCAKISIPIVIISLCVQLGIGAYLYTMNNGVLKCTSV